FSNFDATFLAIQTQNQSLATGRFDQIEQQADRSSFTGAVWPQKPKNLSLTHLKVHFGYTPATAIIFRQVFSLDSKTVIGDSPKLPPAWPGTSFHRASPLI